MPVSSNSFFHFTKKYDDLLSILSNGFRIAVSHEVVPNRDRRSVVGVPMVCFCYIPISACSIHAKHYSGDNVFAFGMRNAWGIEKLHPVQYYSNKISKFFQDSLVDLTSMYLENPDPMKPEFLSYLDGTSYTSNIYENNAVTRTIRLNEIIGLIKPAESDYYRLDRDTRRIKLHNSGYKFYDEREWRYTHFDEVSKVIPIFKVEDVELYNINTVDSYFEEADKLWEYFNEVENHLKFDVRDISWVIVDNDETVERLISAISSQDFAKIGGNLITNDLDKYLLAQKIVSYDRLQKDVFSH